MTNIIKCDYNETLKMEDINPLNRSLSIYVQNNSGANWHLVLDPTAQDALLDALQEKIAQRASTDAKPEPIEA